MAQRSGVLDASVLYVESVRSLLLWIADGGGFAPFWTERILRETRNNLIEGGVIAAEQWDRLREAMVTAFPEAMIDQGAVDAIEDEMPNETKDRHVLAAALVADADLVVTSNVRHFLPADLARVGKRGVTPDDFLCELLRTVPNVVRESLELQAAHTRTPRMWTVAELLGLLAGLGHGDAQVPEFAASAARAFGVDPAPPARAS
jgi:SAM-dependent methyltransferase